MVGFSVSGLSSGIDTNALISQLIQVERAPIARLQQRSSSLNAEVAAWRDLDKSLSELRSAFAELGGDELSTRRTVVSDNDALATFSANSSAATGEVRFTVNSLATAHHVAAAAAGEATDLVGAGQLTVASRLGSIGATSAAVLYADGAAAGGEMRTHEIVVESINGSNATISVDGHSQTVAVGAIAALTDGQGNNFMLEVGGGGLAVGTAKVSVVRTDAATTLNGMVSMLSEGGASASAYLVNTGDGSGPPTLSLLAAETGTSNALTVVNSGIAGLGSFATQHAATDAEIEIGTGLTATRSSNTFDDVIEGLTIDLHGADPLTEITATIARDDATVVSRVEKAVEDLNKVMSEIARATSYNSESGAGGVLVGDSRLRRVRSTLQDAMGSTFTGDTFAFAGAVGIELGRDGRYTLDADALRDALARDPDAVTKLFAGDGETTGLATRMDAALGYLQNKDNGLVSTAIESTTNVIDDVADRIDDYETRMVLIETRLRRQFSTMETMLGQLNSQSSQLAQALGSLPR